MFQLNKNVYIMILNPVTKCRFQYYFPFEILQCFKKRVRIKRETAHVMVKILIEKNEKNPILSHFHYIWIKKLQFFQHIMDLIFMTVQDVIVIIERTSGVMMEGTDYFTIPLANFFLCSPIKNHWHISLSWLAYKGRWSSLIGSFTINEIYTKISGR